MLLILFYCVDDWLAVALDNPAIGQVPYLVSFVLVLILSGIGFFFRDPRS